ncbi:hypothetical protein EQ500_11465 [Lactobacillus sp. XV13L]|nr:hypothetical protein [Lactobacillus sp. XV13L]
MDLATLPVDCTDEALQYSWFIQQQLLPVEQMDTYVTKFGNSFDKSTYELITRVATVEELAHKWGLEKVTLEKNKEEALKVFTIWWHKMCLTNKLLVISQFQKLNLKQYFKPVMQL